MIKRIVKMTFREEGVDPFIHDVFESSKAAIRSVPGCLHMELLQMNGQPNVLFTFSIWESEAALDRYRHSDLFRDTWAKTKALFAEKAEAWSTTLIDAPGE
jgi:heme-degrading monooxygenase HmoA